MIRAIGLDVYVGTLTRYHSGDWETIVAAYARERGLEYGVVGPDGQPVEEEERADSAAVAEIVLEWQRALGEALGRPLAWVEDASAPYFTNKPDWDGYGSVQVLAAAVERGKRKLPRTAVADWTSEKTWRKATKGPAPRFRHLYFPEFWLPVELGVPIGAPDPAGNDVVVGSSERLLADLRAVNEVTFRGSPAELAEWARNATEADAPFDDTARFGLGALHELAEASVRERLPLRLDY